MQSKGVSSGIHEVLIAIADCDRKFIDGARLFHAYADSLHLDLSYQDFEAEIAQIASRYGPPEGALLLAYTEDLATGCAGITKWDDTTAELKRMYVMPDYRGRRIGYRLLDHALYVAAESGYQCIRLDTLPDMKRAQELYRAFGFYEISAYRYNPVSGTIYMERSLR